MPGKSIALCSIHTWHSLKTCVIHTPNARACRKDLKTEFTKWCRANGHSGLAGEEPRRMFAGLRDALAEMGIPFCEKSVMEIGILRM